MKLPAFQFYPGDWRKDPGVQCLNFHDRGVWLEILCLMHESEQRGKLLLNGKPMPEDALARVLGLDKQILTTTLTNLLTYGVAGLCSETGALISRRMVRDENVRKVRQEAGKLGGNPDLLKQKPTTRVKQKSTPSSSSSSSSSEVNKGRARSMDEVLDFCLSAEVQLTKQDAEYVWHKWEGNGWTNDGNPIKNWKATIRQWKTGGFFPSQKQPKAFGGQPALFGNHSEILRLRDDFKYAKTEEQKEAIRKQIEELERQAA